MIYLLAAAGIFLLELFIKNKIDQRKGNSDTELLNGKLLIRKSINKGAFMNIGESKQVFVKLLSVVLTVVMLIYFLLTLTKGGSKTLKWGLALLLGGAFSNTYDRLKREYVVDYVSFGVKSEKLRNIVFNLSDFCIMIGSLLIAIKK